MQRRLLALLALWCFGLLLTAGGQGSPTTRFDEQLIARVSGGGLALSPDGSRFAYVSRHGSHGDLFAVNADGSGELRLSHNASLLLRWSPDGGRVLFLSRRGFSVANADGSGVRTLTSDDAEYDDASWSPDGRWIVFASRPPHVNESAVYVMKADGTGRRRLSSPSNKAASPSWSPNGDLIAFVRTRASHSISERLYSDLFVIGADETNPRQLTHGRRTLVSSPVWSPDGRTIAFEIGPPKTNVPESMDGCRGDIAVIDADGTDQRRVAIVNRYSGCRGPVWSPDGSRIAFARVGHGSAVYVVNIDGRGHHRVTEYVGNPIAGVWWPTIDRLLFTSFGSTPDRPNQVFADVFATSIQ